MQRHKRPSRSHSPAPDLFGRHVSWSKFLSHNACINFAWSSSCGTSICRICYLQSFLLPLTYGVTFTLALTFTHTRTHQHPTSSTNDSATAAHSSEHSASWFANSPRHCTMSMVLYKKGTASYMDVGFGIWRGVWHMTEGAPHLFSIPGCVFERFWHNPKDGIFCCFRLSGVHIILYLVRSAWKGLKTPMSSDVYTP